MPALVLNPGWRRSGLPSLLISAADDPLIPIDTYCNFDWRQNCFLAACLPASGGHVGFHAAGSRARLAQPSHRRILRGGDFPTDASPASPLATGRNAFTLVSSFRPRMARVRQ